MGPFLILAVDKLFEVEPRVNVTGRTYYIVEVDGHTVHFIGNPEYAGGGPFLVPDEMPDDLEADLLEEIAAAITARVLP